MSRILKISDGCKKYLTKKFATDTVWLMAAQATLMLCAFCINVIIGVKLGANSLGIFNQSLAYYSIMSCFIGLGLNNTIIKKISEFVNEPAFKKEIFSATFFTTAFFSIIITAVSIVIVFTFPQMFSSLELADVIFAPLLALPFFNLNKNFMAFYSGVRNQKRNGINKIVRWLLLLIYISLASGLTDKIKPLLFSFCIVEFVILIGNVLFNMEIFTFKFSAAIIISNIKFGLTSFVSEFISVIYEYADLIIIGYLLSQTEVGVYSFLIFFVKTLYVFPGIVQQNINPIVSNLWSNGKMHQLEPHLKDIRKVNFLVVSVQLLFVLIAFKVVTLTVKQEFIDSYYYFLLAIPGPFIFSLIAWSSAMLVMTGKLAKNNYRTLLIIIFSIISTITFTYFFKLAGACMAFSVNAIIAFLITRRYLEQALKIKLIG